MTLRTCLLAAMLLLSPLATRAEYVAQPGDVLELTVTGAPALNQRVTVGADGDITLPLIGQVRATDVGPGELGRRIQSLLVAGNVVHRGDTIVSVVEYSPIYVDGDVARPGEYGYRPGMTVRVAITLAGGLDMTRGFDRLTPAQLSEARADYGATAVDLARQQAQIARIEAELAGEANLDPAAVTDTAGVPAPILEEIIAAEARQMEAERTARANERAHAERMLEVVRGEVTALERAEEQQRTSYEQAVAEARRALDLADRGVGTTARAEIAERSLAQARSQLLDVEVRLAQARREAEERAQQVATFDDERRALQLNLLREAVAEASKARFRLQSARERLTARSGDLPGGGGAAEPDILIRRMVDGSIERMRADLDMALRPGDSVEVTSDTRLDGAKLSR